MGHLGLVIRPQSHELRGKSPASPGGGGGAALNYRYHLGHYHYYSRAHSRSSQDPLSKRLMMPSGPWPPWLPVEAPPSPWPGRTLTTDWPPQTDGQMLAAPLPGPAGCEASPPPPEQVSFKKPED